ncbi:PREDICTED: serine protease 53-like [Nicrophorus vespilloides]|uniref:Serine protease 53-like n=1 Tax=Nicrophorus vespilloides TaxID=110193 RepID=A0ABM1NEV6_NICVS|nr:PREDICTED: serine protease 53-like [Nicrophorus vespilloides]
MKCFVVLALAAVAFAAPQSQITTLKDLYAGGYSSRIISGSPAKQGQFPWQVAINFVTAQGSFFCGGALIDAQWVLTAAHCADGAYSFNLKLGGVSLSGSEAGRVEVSTTYSIVHPGYNNNLNNDIALIRMPNPIKFSDNIRPVKLPKRGSVIGSRQEVTVSGWGKTSDSGSVSNNLNFVKLVTITNDECAAIYGPATIIKSTVCCKGFPEHSTCNGDSGGPLVVIENGEATHVGVVSFVHIAGCASGNPSGYVRTESFLDWIHDNTGISVLYKGRTVSESEHRRIMKCFIVLALAAVAFAAPQSQITTLKDLYAGGYSSRIISGSPAKQGQFPWQVAVNFVTPQGSFFCGGALIDAQWVLTAAHCAEGAYSFRLQIGGVSLNGNEAGRIEVSTTYSIVHPGYNNNLNNDIALIKMPNPISFTDNIRPVKLPKRGSVVGDRQEVTVSGWGKTSDFGSVSNSLNFVKLVTISNAECAAIYGPATIIKSTVCCKGFPEHSTCNGDSGGPLVVIENGEATHVGVVSFVSSAGCASGNPSGYVRTESFLDWIHDNTGISV